MKKSALLGVLMGASVPKNSPRIALPTIIRCSRALLGVGM